MAMALKTLFAMSVAEVPSASQITRVGREYPVRKCKFQEEKFWGFKSFDGKEGTDEEFATPLYNGRWIHLQIANFKPIIPGPVVRRHVAEKIKEFTKQHGEEPGSKEKREIKEQVRDNLRQQAFQKETIHQVIFDSKTNQVWLEATSETVQTEILRVLRRGLGSLPAVPVLEVANLPSIFAGWIAGERDLPEGFHVGDSAKAIDPDDPKATIRNP